MGLEGERKKLKKPTVIWVAETCPVKVSFVIPLGMWIWTLLQAHSGARPHQSSFVLGWSSLAFLPAPLSSGSGEMKADGCVPGQSLCCCAGSCQLQMLSAFHTARLKSCQCSERILSWIGSTLRLLPLAQILTGTYPFWWKPYNFFQINKKEGKEFECR